MEKTKGKGKQEKRGTQKPEKKRAEKNQETVVQTKRMKTSTVREQHIQDQNYSCLSKDAKSGQEVNDRGVSNCDTSPTKSPAIQNKVETKAFCPVARLIWGGSVGSS